MAVTIINTAGPIFTAQITGKLSKSDIGHIQALARDAVRRCGKISALFILEDFQGWQREGEWGDDSFLAEHDKDIDKIAVVGEDEWRDFACAFLAKGFRQADVEFFPPADLSKAQEWLGGNLKK